MEIRAPKVPSRPNVGHHGCPWLGYKVANLTVVKKSVGPSEVPIRGTQRVPLTCQKTQSTRDRTRTQLSLSGAGHHFYFHQHVQSMEPKGRPPGRTGRKADHRAERVGLGRRRPQEGPDLAWDSGKTLTS